MLWEHAVQVEAEQTDRAAGLLQSHLPADGGVDLQPPDEAFPPFLWSNIMQSFIMRESLQDAIFETDFQNRATHEQELVTSTTKKFSKCETGS